MRRANRSIVGLGIALGTSLAMVPVAPSSAADAAPTTATAPAFMLRDVARPVLFFGDDATAQRMFTTLVETYTLSRFPAWTVTFRNTGLAGDKILAVGPRGYSRDQIIRRDIEAFRPQIAIVNYGDNDARDGDAGMKDFRVRMNVLCRDLPRIGVYRMAFLSPSPAEGTEAGAPAGSKFNLALRTYADVEQAQLPVSWKDGVDSVRAHPKGPELPRLADGVFVDVLNPMIGLIEAGRAAGVLARDGGPPTTLPRLVHDGDHPGWAGHLVIAATLLQALHAPDLVSAAELDAPARATRSATGCTITWQDTPAGVIQFQRLDDALPWPTPPEVDPALRLPGFDLATTLNRYELKVTGLAAPAYTLSIDGQPIGTYKPAELAAGVNLGFVRRGPIYDQGQRLLKAVVEKNDAFAHRWQDVQLGPPPPAGTSAADQRKLESTHLATVRPELARLDAAIAEQERAIRTLCRPVAHTFRLEPAKP
jgi:hypothetical protein